MVWNENDTVTESAKSEYRLISYTTTGAEYYGGYMENDAPSIGNSLHLAVSSDGGKTYEPLNSNVGVLYAKADYSDRANDKLYGDEKYLRSPYLFKLNDGGWGVIAARGNVNGTADETDGCAAVYTSEDLLNFDFIGYLKLDTKPLYDIKCGYNNGEYIITWASFGNSIRKKTITKDFVSIGEITPSDDEYEIYQCSIEHIVQVTNVLNIPKSIYIKLKSTLNAPENIGIEEFKTIRIKSGEKPELPKKAKAIYNDGSVQNYSVNWKIKNMDLSKPGEYIINGTVETNDYPSNFLDNLADPCILKYQGKYYFAATRDDGSQIGLNIREADTIAGIANAEKHELYSNGNALVWAPEIHVVEGKLMIFFATGFRWDSVQCHVMVLNGTNPLDKESWSVPERIKLKDGVTNITDKGISLDMTCFNWNKKWYLAWSQRLVNSGNKNIHESANIYIAEYNPAEPAKLAGDAVVISRPEFGWERTKSAVDEGPFTIANKNTLYMTIAVNGTNSSYGIKLLTLKENGSPINPNDWTAKGYPLLCSAMNTSEPGPGHSSFMVGENGEPILVYHWGSRGTGRTSSIKNVHFNKSGEPVLNILREEQVKSEYKKVSIKIVVE